MEEIKRLARQLVQARDEKKLHTIRAQVAQEREQKLLEEFIDALVGDWPDLQDRMLALAEPETGVIATTHAPQGL